MKTILTKIFMKSCLGSSAFHKFFGRGDADDEDEKDDDDVEALRVYWNHVFLYIQFK